MAKSTPSFPSNLQCPKHKERERRGLNIKCQNAEHTEPNATETRPHQSGYSLLYNSCPKEIASKKIVLLFSFSFSFSSFSDPPLEFTMLLQSIFFKLPYSIEPNTYTSFIFNSSLQTLPTVNLRIYFFLPLFSSPKLKQPLWVVRNISKV